MTQTQNKMADLYARLAGIGFPKKFIQQKILPQWWNDEVDATPGVVTEGALYISRRLNLDLRSLLTNDTQPVFESTCQPKFKLKARTDNQQLRIPRELSARIAELVAYACKRPYQPLNTLTVADIRHQILQNRKTVDLQGFLDFCWNRGIPVIHFSEFPSGVHKFHGMVAYFYHRPVILVSLKDFSPSRLLFIIAHEFGHLLKGHLNQEGVLIDETIELESVDTEEFEANEVAGELLLGRADMSYYSPHNYTGDRLAQYAEKISIRDRVDPGVVAWNYAWHKKHWAVVQKALKILEPNANAPQAINHYLLENLDWEKLGDDNQDYLFSMLKLVR